MADYSDAYSSINWKDDEIAALKAKLKKMEDEKLRMALETRGYRWVGEERGLTYHHLRCGGVILNPDAHDKVCR